MIVKFTNGDWRHIDHAETVIVPDATGFDIDNPDTWQSDRAWVFVRPGQRLWLGREAGVQTVESFS